jgi:hypothetical protein
MLSYSNVIILDFDSLSYNPDSGAATDFGIKLTYEIYTSSIMIKFKYENIKFKEKNGKQNMPII